MTRNERRNAARAAKQTAAAVEPAMDDAGASDTADVVEGAEPAGDAPAEAVALTVVELTTDEKLAQVMAELAALRAASELAAKEAADKAAAAEAAKANARKPQRLTDVVAICPFEKGSNRADWYAFVKEHEGKTVAEVMDIAEALAKDGKAVSYHKRGKRAGQAENTAEWLDWLSMPKQGVMKLTRS